MGFGFGGHGGGGWFGPMGTVGGLTRTYGLQDHFTKAGSDGQPPKVSRAGLQRICGYYKPYRKRWLVILACIAITACLGVLPAICVKEIIDRAIPESNGTLLGMMACAMVGLALTSGMIGILQQTLTARVGQSIMFDLRNELYRHLQRMSLRFYTATRSGEIVSRINNDVNAVQGVATSTVVQIANNTLTLVAASLMLFSINWRLTLLAVLVVPAFYLPSKIVGAIRRRLSIQTQEAQASLLAFLNERLHIGGAILTNIFGQRQADARVFHGASAEVRDLNIKQAIVGRWLFMILSVFSAIGPAMIYWYGGYQIIQKQLTLGLLIAFAALLTQLYRPLVQLATVYVDIQGAFGVFERIFEYLDMKAEVEDSPQPKTLPQVAGHIVFNNVRFSYPKPILPASGENGDSPPENGKEQFALRDLSFEIAPGQRVALVGPSGAGKTTITYLVPRFYDPDEGSITLDGRDLRELGQEDLRRHIGMVTQETFLFHASVRENLLYAKPNADDREIVDACKAANIHEFIDALPDGYLTVVGERGFRLSGGEKQRLSIARALLKNPAILILDEATSSLDATSEFLIQTALEKLLQGRTSLIIAHRLSTILSADKIVVLEAGRVVERGRHSNLVENRGLYARLFEQQFGKVLEMNERQMADA